MAQTIVAAPPLVPEIRLRLARDSEGIFLAVDAAEQSGPKLQPYWGFAWPGGQATARWLLDHPETVKGKRVIDIGAGSGIAAIAAALAGARHVLAADIDPLAVLAIGLNARLNGVAVACTGDDILGELPPADLVLLGDLVYEPDTAVRVAALLEAVASTGGTALIGDRAEARRLQVAGARRGRETGAVAFDLVAEYDAPLTPALAGHPFNRGRLWRLQGKT